MDENEFGGRNPNFVYTPMTEVEQEVVSRLVESGELVVILHGWGFMEVESVEGLFGRFITYWPMCDVPSFVGLSFLGLDVEGVVTLTSVVGEAVLDGLEEGFPFLDTIWVGDFDVLGSLEGECSHGPFL